MNTKLIKVVTGVILMGVMMPGCIGYQLGSSLPPDIKNIFIPTFINQCKEPLIEVEATNATIAEFLGNVHDKAEIAADHAVAGLHVAVLDDSSGQLLLFLRRKQRGLVNLPKIEFQN